MEALRTASVSTAAAAANCAVSHASRKAKMKIRFMAYYL
jgi:Na+/H+ antiporter NhaD/arsenite permease-like protein